MSTKPIPGRTRGPLLGIRAFRVKRGQLLSLTAGEQRWPRGVVDARCEAPPWGHVPHLAPAVGCRCGAYAVDSVATLQRVLHRLVSPWPWVRSGLVIGVVQMWGAPARPVIVGELRGRPGYQYRAPHARVLALAESRSARRVAKRLGLPVVPLAGLELYAREVHGCVQLRPGAPEQRRAKPALDWRSRRDLARLLGRAALLGGRALAWMLRRRLTWVGMGIAAYVALYWHFPTFMGLLTGVVISIAFALLLLMGWLRGLTR